MTTFPRPAPTTILQPLREFARRWSPSRTTKRAARPPRLGTLAHPPAQPIDLWEVDHTELRTALDESWH